MQLKQIHEKTGHIYLTLELLLEFESFVFTYFFLLFYFFMMNNPESVWEMTLNIIFLM